MSPFPDKVFLILISFTLKFKARSLSEYRAERLFQGDWNSWSRHDQAPGQVLARRAQPYFS